MSTHRTTHRLRRCGFAGVVAIAVAVAGACAPDPGVETEQSQSIEPVTPTSEPTPGPATGPAPSDDPDVPATTTDSARPDDPTTSATTVVPTSSGPDQSVPDQSVPDESAPDQTVPSETTPLETVPPDPDEDVLVFDLEQFDVTVRRRPTTVVEPADDVVERMFGRATVLADGSIVASGSEFPADAGAGTFGALWRSDDAFEWTRVGTEVIESPTRQQIPFVVTDDAGRAVVPVADIAFPQTYEGLTSSWRSDDGVEWEPAAAIGDASVRAGVASDDGLVFGGVAGSGSSTFTAAVYAEPTDPDPDSADAWTETRLDPDGGASLVADVIDVDGTLLAVGGAARTDPDGAAGTTLVDMTATTGPVDVAVWRSTGGVWRAAEADALTGVAGAARAEQVVDVDGELFLLVVSSDGVPDARRVIEVYRSDDLGDSWELMPLPASINGDADPAGGASGTGDLGSGLWVVDGALVMVVDHVLDDGRQRVFMTVVDPTNDEAVTHDVTDALGMESVADVITVGGLSLGFGNSSVSDDPAGLQTIEIVKVESSPSGGTPSNA